jgi:cobalt-zinc-cadmium efflux system outer membrane protein
MKYACALLLSLALFSANVIAQLISGQIERPRVESLASLIDEALGNNSDIAAEKYKMEAAIRRIPQSGALDDPELVLKLMEIPGTRFNEAMYANIELMQMIPFPTKLSARRAISTLLSEHAHHDHLEKTVQIVADLKNALAMLSFNRESRSINAGNQELLKRILKVTETFYTVGKAPQQEILRTKIELAKLVADEAKIQEQIITTENMVRKILNRPSETPIGPIDFGSPSPLPPIEDLFRFAEHNKPMLVHDSLNVTEKEMTLQLMKQEYIPDFKFSVEYVRLPVAAENRWSISAGITLPFAPWTLAKASSRVQEAESEKMMLSSMYTSSKTMVQSQIRSRLATLEALGKELHQIRDVALPLITQSIDLLLTDYETGRTSYLMVLDSYRMYNDMRLDLAMIKANYYQTFANLEREVGVTDISFVGGSRKEH